MGAEGEAAAENHRRHRHEEHQHLPIGVYEKNYSKVKAQTRMAKIGAPLVPERSVIPPRDRSARTSISHRRHRDGPDGTALLLR